MRAEDLIRSADCAMYTAKKQGKNQARLFSDTAVDSAEKYLRLESELRTGLASGELIVYYQPIYSLRKQRWEDFEALSRWNHSERGLVSPAEFIPLAEETGLILELGKQTLRAACHQGTSGMSATVSFCEQVSTSQAGSSRTLTSSTKSESDLILELGRWALREAIRRFAEWRSTGLVNSSANIAVNLSAGQFLDTQLVNIVDRTLNLYSLPPHCLSLEITEGTLIHDVSDATHTLKRLKALSVELTLTTSAQDIHR